MTREHQRLKESRAKSQLWKKWGPYLSERQWGTVREDYSADGNAWGYFPHEHARSRAYRWGEDGLAGISDDLQVLCFSLALWNGKDRIIKERAFGLTGPEGNRGEDVKEYYFYIDSTPTHSYMKYLYKYPHAAYPYQDLVEENRRRNGRGYEYELLDTGVFDEDRYFDVFVEYAKKSPEDILIQITVHNRGSEAAPLTVLPHLWFRNTWAWGKSDSAFEDNGDGLGGSVPMIRREKKAKDFVMLRAIHPVTVEAYLNPTKLGDYYLYGQNIDDKEPILMFTDNETNSRYLYNHDDGKSYTKDSINDAVVSGAWQRVNPDEIGTKVALNYQTDIEAGGSKTFKLRLCKDKHTKPFAGFDETVAERVKEADEFYTAIHPPEATDDEKRVQRQAFAGLMWSKQFYYYELDRWFDGDNPRQKPPASRRNGRNRTWKQLNAMNIISMPDKWEYPWFAVWDSAFHCVAIALIDPDFAKDQLELFVADAMMHQSGQIPAYEWEFSDLNPPVHAWATWEVYQRERKFWAAAKEEFLTGGDRHFLETVYHRLIMNFMWWVNKKDADGSNIFEGGFLGLDNIAIIDRSEPLPNGLRLEQADATGWMGMYCLNLFKIASELAHTNSAYQDLATKFFEHFMYVGDALNNAGGAGIKLWNEDEGFYYDIIHIPNTDRYEQIKVRSLVGLIPLFAVNVLEQRSAKAMPDFVTRLRWFVEHRQDTFGVESYTDNHDSQRLFAILGQQRLARVLDRMLDENEFLSPFGLRALSKHHEANPYFIEVAGTVRSVHYEPAEAETKIKGGNSNWRGPIWMPTNYLLIHSLRQYYAYFGVEYDHEFPTGSGNWLDLHQIADELSRRLIRIFLRDETGKRPVYGGIEKFQNDPYWRDYILFHEYFHADNGAGLGASHQTGWTGIVAKLIHDIYNPNEVQPQQPRRRRPAHDPEDPNYSATKSGNIAGGSKFSSRRNDV